MRQALRSMNPLTLNIIIAMVFMFIGMIIGMHVLMFQESASQFLADYSVAKQAIIDGSVGSK